MGPTETELIMAAVVVVIVALITRHSFFNPSSTSSFNIAIVLAGLFFGVGPWLAFFHGDLSFVTTDKTLPIEPVILLFKAYLVVLLYVAGLWAGANIFSFFKKRNSNRLLDKEFSVIRVFQKYWMVRWPTIVVIMSLVWILRFIIILRYGIWVSGSATLDKVLSQPYYIIVLTFLSQTIALGCLAWSAASFWADKRLFTKYAGACILTTEFCWMFLKGRSIIIVWLVLTFLGFLSSRRKFLFRYVLIFFVLTLLIYQFVFPFFLNFRNSYHHAAQMNISNPIKRFVKTVVLSCKGSYAISQNNSTSARILFKQSMSTRPLYLRRFICRICEGLDRTRPMIGRALLCSVESVIPAVIYPNKSSNLATEQLIQKHFHYPLQDTASTWPAIGCADFGIPGGLIAGMIVALWIACTELGTQVILNRHPLVGISLIAGMITCLVRVETGPTLNWMLWRDIAVILVIAEGAYLLKSVYFHITRQT